MLKLKMFNKEVIEQLAEAKDSYDLNRLYNSTFHNGLAGFLLDYYREEATAKPHLMRLFGDIAYFKEDSSMLKAAQKVEALLVIVANHEEIFRQRLEKMAEDPFLTANREYAKQLLETVHKPLQSNQSKHATFLEQKIVLSR